MGSARPSCRRRVAALIGGLAIGAAACAKPLPEAQNCALFPVDHYLHANVSQLPVHPRSDAWVAAIGADASVHADFGAGEWAGGPIGIPYVVVGAEQPSVSVDFEYASESDVGRYPLPPDAPIEGGPDATGDRHVLVVDRDECTLHELFAAHPLDEEHWTAGSGAIWDLGSNALRPRGWTSADAAGLPILPMLVRHDEVAAGRIGHALRFTAPRTQDAYIWPARHRASSDGDPNLPPMGAWFRLRSTVDISDYPPDVRVILQALKTHGMILADNGSPWYLSGTPSENWDNDVLRALRDLRGSDFEAVDTSAMMRDPDRAAAVLLAR